MAFGARLVTLLLFGKLWPAMGQSDEVGLRTSLKFMDYRCQMLAKRGVGR